jgi:hypothetical protein
MAWSCAGENLGNTEGDSKIHFEKLNQWQALNTPVSWGAECGVFMQVACETINMINAKVMVENWPLLDSQEYILDLEMNVSRAVVIL